ncbi:hypothetical protein Syun_003455 [Stephania yunnanensis]|uniref:Uncharacterized protein n=1 Tax=Stephania yunnanensis TaxID=152371 RepID=A0AAP0L172_9MAGN
MDKGWARHSRLILSFYSNRSIHIFCKVETYYLKFFLFVLEFQKNIVKEQMHSFFKLKLEKDIQKELGVLVKTVETCLV